jgi:MFS family permease
MLATTKTREKTQHLLITLSLALASFLLYSSMYAFRKSFTVAVYGDLTFYSIDYKIWLVVAQTIGYTASKFFGIKIIAELNYQKRGIIIFGLVLIAWLTLLFFALIPSPYNIIVMLINGFPLGLIWGYLFSYLEGRRTTEFLGAFLSISFIFSSGFVKAVGKWLMVDWGVGVFWMPFITGLLCLPVVGMMVIWLEKLPPPSGPDIEERTLRVSMSKLERVKFIRQFATGILLLVVSYVFLTMMRDFRDNFIADIWYETGLRDSPQIFVLTEIPVSVIVLMLVGTMFLIKNNFRALVINHYLILTGVLLLLLSTFLFQLQWISASWWMICTGTGLYLAYIPFNCLVFERLIAAFKHPATVGFIMYIADSFGYLGSISLLLVKEFGFLPMTSYLSFFQGTAYVLGGLIFILMILSIIYFSKKFSRIS